MSSAADSGDGNAEIVDVSHADLPTLLRLCAERDVDGADQFRQELDLLESSHASSARKKQQKKLLRRRVAAALRSAAPPPEPSSPRVSGPFGQNIRPEEERARVLEWAALPETFVRARVFGGQRDGRVFRTGKQGTGYYRDVPLIDLLRERLQPARILHVERVSGESCWVDLYDSKHWEREWLDLERDGRRFHAAYMYVLAARRRDPDHRLLQIARRCNPLTLDRVGNLRHGERSEYASQLQYTFLRSPLDFAAFAEFWLDMGTHRDSWMSYFSGPGPPAFAKHGRKMVRNLHAEAWACLRDSGD